MDDSESEVAFHLVLPVLFGDSIGLVVHEHVQTKVALVIGYVVISVCIIHRLQHFELPLHHGKAIVSLFIEDGFDVLYISAKQGIL
jgi:hypothetical protein